MIKVEKAWFEDLPAFAAMEQAADAKEFIIPYTYTEHAEKMTDPNLVYLRILERSRLAGFLILGLDADGSSVEFRRIVVSAKDRGVGQQAISCMEGYCRTELRRSRIWLDVFAHNHRGRHIYEKLEYKKFGESHHSNNTRLLYEKLL